MAPARHLIGSREFLHRAEISRAATLAMVIDVRKPSLSDIAGRPNNVC
jgi:hypothetical protein